MKKKFMSVPKVYTAAQERLAELYRARKRVVQALQSAPEGKIHIVRSGKYVSYYLRTDPKDPSGRYLRASEKDVKKKFVQKSYNEKLLPLLNCEISALEDVLRVESCPEQIRNLALTFPEKCTRDAESSGS